ncbi:hypothetical protein [Desulfurispira natronophila]|uniref:Lipoprotein n=1 Tax=Desulfurispira natronophila TaxID=682562 RepID=A0A7W8DFV6_9BACT|nr:hypothetical protein [Desulfurispira natronophila]MBB5020836.1 hypothetical protein [Desulfurispira natronophila]
MPKPFATPSHHLKLGHAFIALAIITVITAGCATVPAERKEQKTTQNTIPPWAFFTASSYGLDHASACTPIESSPDSALTLAIAKAREELEGRQGRVLPAHLRGNPTFAVIKKQKGMLDNRQYYCVLMQIRADLHDRHGQPTH